MRLLRPRIPRLDRRSDRSSPGWEPWNQWCFLWLWWSLEGFLFKWHHFGCSDGANCVALRARVAFDWVYTVICVIWSSIKSQSNLESWTLLTLIEFLETNLKQCRGQSSTQVFCILPQQQVTRRPDQPQAHPKITKAHDPLRFTSTPLAVVAEASKILQRISVDRPSQPWNTSSRRVSQIWAFRVGNTLLYELSMLWKNMANLWKICKSEFFQMFSA